MTACHSMMLLSVGVPLTPGGGSFWKGKQQGKVAVRVSLGAQSHPYQADRQAMHL
jgi:hypothetical protein